MADFQTQVVDQNTLSSSDLNVSARVNQFKTELGDIRSIRVGMVEQMRGLVAKVKSLAFSQGHLINLFSSEASKMFPAIVLRDAWEYAQSSEAPFQLAQLWSQYNLQYQNIETQIKALVNQYNGLLDSDLKLAAEEKQILFMYTSMQLPGAPSADQLMSELAALDVLESVEEGSVIAKASALEELNPETADMVTLQAVDMETNYDRSMVNSALEQSMLPSEEAVSANIESLSMRSSGSSFDLMASIKQNWQAYAIGAAVCYVLFGGRSK